VLMPSYFFYHYNESVCVSSCVFCRIELVVVVGSVDLPSSSSFAVKCVALGRVCVCLSA